MASNEENWIGDTVNDFIHSSIWLSPIQTFLDNHCASFDIDEDNSSSTSTSNVEEETIYRNYQKLVRSLIDSLGDDLKLDKRLLNDFCQQTKNSIVTDESDEQLCSANDFDLFKEMMRRKNLILQLQAMVHLQMECGVLKPNETEDDRILKLLVDATKPMKTTTKIPEDILREKLDELTLNEEKTSSSSISSREEFLKEQRDLIIEKQRRERIQALESETKTRRPQSAAMIAKNAMENQSKALTDVELEKRRTIAAKLRREVVEKH